MTENNKNTKNAGDAPRGGDNLDAVIDDAVTAAIAAAPESIEGALTDDALATYSTAFNASRANRVAATAATSAGVIKAATDYQGLRALPRDEFSIELKQGSITAQEHSGRCWMFAALNTLSHDVIRRWDLDDFEFSETYLFFYDKIEKSNFYLEQVLATLDEPTDSRLFQAINDYPADDGGWWTMFASLAAKYGLVPKSAYPETANTRDSDAFTQYLNAKLREFALELRKAHALGEGMAELRALKDGQMADVYRIVTIALGEPPKTFDWTARKKDDADDKDGKDTKAATDAAAGTGAAGAPAKKKDGDGFVSGELIREFGITPREFYAKYVQQDLDRYVGLVNAP
ncbi:C1 family peptidase, partial [Bifidobacterium aesculapii]|uniref:C1 family peptidase n=1 Tax=Bifidobacterium aesculapii TaxID=1329411 RepID=UPI000A513DD6